MHQETKDDNLEILVLFQNSSANLSLAITEKAFLMVRNICFKPEQISGD